MSKLSDYSKFDHLDSDSDNDEGPEQQAHVQPARLSTPDQALPDAPTTTHPNTVPTLTTPATTTSTSTIAAASTAAPPPPPSPTSTTSISACMRQNPDMPKRFMYLYNGSMVYEWEQSLQEVTLYIMAPPFLLQDPKRIVCTIASNHLVLGQQQQQQQQQQRNPDTPLHYFLDEDTWQTVDVRESTWCIEDSCIVIYLHKANKGIVWETVLKGRQDSTDTADVTADVTTGTAGTLDPGQLETVRQQLMLERFQEENPGYDFRDAAFNGSVPDPRTFMGGVQHD
jgi:hypothetical protein